ncbi:MAG TPA: hypothetical protein HPP51_06115, partial [Planctomycetes bacterium]|nr:hypothetical protein [Planctomycetota bacterium]
FKKSLPLQLTDLVAYYARKYEEDKQGLKVNEYDKQTFGIIEALSSAGFGPNMGDILDWVKANFVK